LGVRIQVDPGALDQPGFAGISQTITSIIQAATGPLGSAAGACGNSALAGAISDLSDAIGTADQSAALSVSGLGQAALKAAQQYQANEAAIARAERGR
jgi:hypothetical protein